MAATARDLSKVESVIQLKGVNKWFGQFHVLTDINLDVKEGEKIVICGPSGSGKSTLIRCINRLEEHQRGDIVVHGVTLSNDVKNIEAIRREVAEKSGTPYNRAAYDAVAKREADAAAARQQQQQQAPAATTPPKQ